MERCEICREKEATTICIRCRRIICEDCSSPHAWLCKECYEFKKSIEEDRDIMLDYVRKMTKICSASIRNSSCANCIILRETVLSLYKMLKDIKEEAQREYFESLIKKAEEIEKELRLLLISLLISQGLRIPDMEFRS